MADKAQKPRTVKSCKQFKNNKVKVKNPQEYILVEQNINKTMTSETTLHKTHRVTRHRATRTGQTIKNNILK